MTQAMMIRAYGNTSPLNATAVCVRTGSAYITGACMSIALARTNVETSNVMFDTAVFSTIDLRKIERRRQINGNAHFFYRVWRTDASDNRSVQGLPESTKPGGILAARNYTES